MVSDQSVAPVAIAGKGAEHADADKALRRRAVLPATQQVERERAGPEPDREIGQHRVQRMTEPAAGERVLQLTAPDRAVNESRERLGYRVGCRHRLDAADEGLQCLHEGTLYPASPSVNPGPSRYGARRGP